MYYCPYDDAAVPMVMECVRLSAAATFHLIGRQDPIVAPITAALEVRLLIMIVDDSLMICTPWHH